MQPAKAHREAGQALHTYVQMNRSANWVAGIDFTDVAASKARVAAEFEGWAPALTALITESDAPLVPRLIHALPCEEITSTEQRLDAIARDDGGYADGWGFLSD